jgi:hypothetical protein
MMSLIPKRNHKDNDHQEKGSICGIEQGLIMHELFLGIRQKFAIYKENVVCCK